MKKSLLLVAAGLLSTNVLASNFDDNQEAIEYRKDVFGLIAYNFSDMKAMLKGEKDFNQQLFEMRADNVKALSTMPWEGFVQGSDKGDTDAKSDIWTDSAEFKQKAQAFEQNTIKLVSAAQSGDKKAMKKAFGMTGKSCKGCHDDFKKD